ncbi:molybdopterin cofactor-binding domain-containing protein [Rhodanobacter sp. OK091]|uniref:xanthine dehydrogenase family protein molybdopterin-binding subunit n=1 Tax=Rhodanobacter sp. OK091 TaxID=1881037 RepID=UPI000916FA13|nr:molybdopterin cofactor-binding domain-containing protein [Rhodanobacter sp. OK091]SHM15228.1 CO or xanthine dehydrogenase, Mo-binding subunit [Rhodanobacter sp. OK091]
MKPADAPVDKSRRAFLAGSGFMVSFALFGSWRALAGETNTLGATILAPDLPGDLKIDPILDSWIKIDAQGVTVCSGKVELGTGVRTALWQIAADQLAMPLDKFKFVTADTALTPDEGYTAGSHSMADGGTAIYHAAIQVRQMLLEAAAAKLGVPTKSLMLRDGIILSGDGRQMTYEEAAQGVNLHQQAKSVSPQGDPSAYRYIGHSIPRVDIPAKVTGGTAYVQDLRLDGMLHARVVRPPNASAQLKEIDTRAIETMRGVVKVVRDGNFLAVLAEHEWEAIQAMRALRERAQWQLTQTYPTNDTIHAVLKTLPERLYVTTRENNGPVKQVLSNASAASISAPASPTRSLAMTKQYVLHGSIGPSCAVAVFRNDMLTVWTHSQGVFPLRAGIAELLGLPKENVRCIHAEGAGCYGHNGADDAACDAAVLAYRTPNRPVRVQWMRDQEAGWEPLGPAMLTEINAVTDAHGKLQSWHHALWSTPHNSRIVNAGRLIPATLLAHPAAPASPAPIPQPEGDADRNAVPLYRIPSVRVDMHFVTDMPFRTSAMRSLGAYINVTTIEGMMDDLAEQFGEDPVAYRLQHLDDPRARDVIQRAANRFGWNLATPLPEGHGIGFAFSQYKNLMGYCAIALEVKLDKAARSVRIVRVVAAVDCGQIVSPDGLTNQIEGGIVQSSSWTLYEQALVGENGVQSVDWSSYPIARFPHIPAAIEVELIDRPGAPFLGAAEIAQAPTAAALINAIKRVVGWRPLHLPVARQDSPIFA